MHQSTHHCRSLAGATAPRTSVTLASERKLYLTHGEILPAIKVPVLSEPFTLEPPKLDQFVDRGGSSRCEHCEVLFFALTHQRGQIDVVRWIDGSPWRSSQDLCDRNM